MSLSNEWTEWHLTPDGWVEGSTRVDFGRTATVPKPGNSVLTIRWREYQSCSFAKMECYHQEVWQSDDEELVAQLLAKHGEAPKHL